MTMPAIKVGRFMLPLDSIYPRGGGGEAAYRAEHLNGIPLSLRSYVLLNEPISKLMAKQRMKAST